MRGRIRGASYALDNPNTPGPCVYPPLKRQLKLYLTLIQHCGITELNIPNILSILELNMKSLAHCFSAGCSRSSLASPEFKNRFLAPVRALGGHVSPGEVV